MACIWFQMLSFLTALLFSLVYFIVGIFVSILKYCLEQG